MNVIRKAGYAGTWYPIGGDEVNSFLDPGQKPREVIGAVCPHAGWIYSGKTAGKVYSSMKPADTYILIGPNHSGLGGTTSLFTGGQWDLPTGSLRIDEEFTKLLMKNSEFLEDDFRAHTREHSLEVQCPFILAANPSARIVPIVMREYNRDIISDIGRSITHCVRHFPEKKYVVIASSDMTHYEPANLAGKLDEYAIAEIKNLDHEGLLRVVASKGITMCGSGPAAAMLFAAKALGARTAKLVGYSHSGAVTGDDTSVVGYAGIIIM